MKVILDTNFLIYCAKEKFDYFEGIEELLNSNYELVVPEQVLIELEKLRDDKFKKVSGKDKDAASLALKIIDKKIKVAEIKKIALKGKTVDDAIINLAEEDSKNIVCTLDREMRQTLGRVILINKGKRLMLTR
jgi:rRNA-processing protein FCF1